MLNDKILENFISNSDPLDNICGKEFIINVLKFGSYLSMINNRRVNSSVLFLTILENYRLRDIFVEMTGAESERDAFLGVLKLYPILIKSKNTKKLFEKSKKQKKT